jgi:uncharacterized protein (TIGR02145 family)
MGRTTQFTYADLDDNGLPKSDDGKFVYGSSFPNWIATNTGAPNYHSIYGMFPALWGNGLGISGTGQTTANTDVQNLANPCPSGWRVPTQDEWEMLGNYGANPGSAGGSFYTNTSSSSTVTSVAAAGKAAIPTGNPNLVWVTVANGIPDASSWSTTKIGGYALYTKKAWFGENELGDTDGAQKYFTGAPTTRHLYDDDAACHAPLLFLPAAGYRYYYNGSVSNVDSYGYYWSSTVNSTDSYNLNFGSTDVSPSRSSYRAFGFSVRCVAN